MSTDEYHSIAGTQTRGKRMVKLREKHIKLFDDDVKESPYGRSSMISNYSKYTDIILKHWNSLLKFAMLRRLRQHHFKRSSAKQKATEIAARRLCSSTSGKPVLLLYGDGANRGGFLRPVACEVRRRVSSITVNSDALPGVCSARSIGRACLTSMENPCTMRLKLGTRSSRRRSICNARRNAAAQCVHQPDSGCRCRCTAKHCDKPRELGNKCKEHYKKDPWKIRAVAFDSKGRAWDRDVSAAIVIGLLFFARAMGIQEEELGLWKRDTKVQEDQARSFEEIFGQETFEKFGIILRKRRKK